MQRVTEAELESMTPVQRIARMVRGAVESLDDARAASDPSARRRDVDRAVAIVDMLDDHLDVEAGGEVAGNLRALYEYVRFRLSDASDELLDAATHDSIVLLERLESGWAELADRSAPSAG